MYYSCSTNPKCEILVSTEWRRKNPHYFLLDLAYELMKQLRTNGKMPVLEIIYESPHLQIDDKLPLLEKNEKFPKFSI